MGLFRKPSTDRAPAAAEVRFSEDSVSVDWHGDLGVLVRSPHIYLDWAVNKDQKGRALDFLGVVAAFVKGSTPGRIMPTVWENVPAVGSPVIEATVAFTDSMRCKVAFRPRRAILDYLYPTFWALWNELALQANEEGPEAIEALVDDLHTQLNYYDEHGIGMRGGVAPVLAGRAGAGRRMEQEIATNAGLTIEQFRALSESERDEILQRDAEQAVERMQQTMRPQEEQDT